MPNNYIEYDYSFYGKGKSILSDCKNAMGGSFYVGTEGLGLYKLNCNDPSIPAIPFGNEGQQGATYASKNVSKVVVTQGEIPHFVFASSLNDGLYKSNFQVMNEDYFVRYFYDPETQGTVPGTCLAIPPDYNEIAVLSQRKMYIFLGTDKKGIFRSVDGGSTWEKLTNSPQNKKIVDILLFSDFSNPYLIYALTEDGKLFYSNNDGINWYEENYAGSEGNPVKGFDLEISPNFIEDGTLFVGTSNGLYKKSLSGWGRVFSLSPVLSVTLSPYFENGVGSDPEWRTVLIGTAGKGIWHSFQWGNPGTFNQIAGFSNSNIPVIRLHPYGDIHYMPPGESYTSALYSIFIADHQAVYSLEYRIFDQGPEYWVFTNIGTSIQDFRFTDIFFDPDFSRSMQNYDVYFGHSNNKVMIWNYNFGNWEVAKGFFHTPPFIYSLSEAPDNPSFVVAGTKGYGPMFSMDGGLTYFPFGSLKYADTVIHEIPAVSITHQFEGKRRVLLSTSDAFGYNLFAHYEIYYGDIYDFSSIPEWERAYFCYPTQDCSNPPLNYSQDNFNGHLIKEIRYTDLQTDIEAADYNFGPIMSDPAQGGGFGKYWQVDSYSSNMPESLSDLSYPMSLIPERGKASFVWGASGLSSGTLRASTPGAYKWTQTEGWSLKNGEGAYELPFADWRAIYSISESEVLIGSGLADGVGIYRTNDGGQRWVQTNRGLETTSMMVKAFTGNSNYIFVAIEENIGPVLRSIPGSNNGGIYMSDCQSKGYAWVYYSKGMTCNSTYELSAGSRIYTGSTCDGIYGFEGDVHIEGDPVAMFSFERNNPWNEREVQFYDRSAGLCTENCATCPDVTWLWWCNDRFLAFDQNPIHIFSSGGTFNCTLNVNRAWNGNTYFTSITIPEVTTLRIEKSGDWPRVYWERLEYDEDLYKYKVYRDTSAEGSGKILLQTIEPGDSTYCDLNYCWYIDTGATGNDYYYRVFTE